MRAAHYAKALAALIEAHPKKVDELIVDTLKLMHANGHDHLQKKLLRSFSRMYEREEKKTTIEVVTAEPIKDSEIQTLLKKKVFSTLLSAKHKRVIRKIDNSLIGGTVVQTGSLRVDQSYKKALIELYQNVIK